MKGATLLCLSLAAAPLTAQAPPVRWLATEDLGCLTPPPALAEVGLAGTDLGVSFPCGEQLVFLFGDSWTLDHKDWDADSVAVTALAPRDAAHPLQWQRRDGGRFHVLAPSGVLLGGMNVPVEGITLGERSYVFFSDDWNARAGRHGRSVCAHAQRGDFVHLTLDHREATDKFVNVSLVADGDRVWIFGTGAYRKSGVFLARVAAGELGQRAAWRYWPAFSADEANAQPLVVSDCIGELSVRRLPGSERWWMTCNATLPRGIHLRTAEAPTGPWSDPVVVFDPSRDRGYGYHMHQKGSAVGYDDGLSEPGREEDWGGEYGPYLVPAWCSSPAPGVQELVYTLSTWNPYTVRVVRSTVADAGAKWQLPAATAKPKPPRAPKNLDFAKGKLTGWQQEGDAFATVARDDGTWFLCTYVAPRGDLVQGRIWQEFTVPATARELRGVVFGGSEAVQLWRGDELLRCTRGRRSNDVEVPFRWTLDEFRGQTVRLQVTDQSTARWGFVSARAIELLE